MWTAEVARTEADYLRAAPFRPLSDDGYQNGPAVFLTLGVHSGYVLDGDTVYWCIEFEPGLVVVRFSGDTLALAALPSPNPAFGGREATADEWEAWDEDAPDPQVELVFTPWDAQFEEDERFVLASEDEDRRFLAAVSKGNALQDALVIDDLEAWRGACLQNLAS